MPDYASLEIPGNAEFDAGRWNELVGALKILDEYAHRIQLIADGKVGVGTSSPLLALQIKNNAGVLGLEGKTHAYISYFPLGVDAAQPRSNRKAWIGFGSFEGPGQKAFSVMNEQNDKLHVGTNGAIALTIDSQGNAGIGTMAPQEKLHVNGNVKVENTLRIAKGNILLGSDGDLIIGPWSVTQTGGGTVTSFLQFSRTSQNVTKKLLSVDWGGNLMAEGSITAKGQINAPTAEISQIKIGSVGRLGIQGNSDGDLVVITNESGGVNADILRLRLKRGAPTATNGYIRFQREDKASAHGYSDIGSIRGKGDAGGLSLHSLSHDFAEYLPKSQLEDSFLPGSIVAISQGRIDRGSPAASNFSIISSNPVVVGNWPEKNAEQDYGMTAFIGQAPARVRGPVKAGDYIFPSPEQDGAGVAVSPEEALDRDITQIAGMAWESNDSPEEKLVNTFVNIPLYGPLIQKMAERMRRLTQRVGELEKELAGGRLEVSGRSY